MVYDKKLIIIGDIHGCITEFRNLLIEADWQPEDRVVLLGDVINRGPDSHACLKLARRIGAESVLGNHELRLLNARKNGSFAELKTADKKTYLSLSKKDWAYIEQFQPMIRVPEYQLILVHAGFCPMSRSRISRSKY